MYSDYLCWQTRFKFGFLVLLIFFFGFSVNSNAAQSKSDAITIEVTGDEFNWYFRYPGSDGVLGTEDDRYSTQNLFLPDNSQITLKITSKDYVYSFALPDLKKEEIAVPELSFEMQFNTGSEKTLRLLGDQLCGYIHKTLIGEVYIRNQDEGLDMWPG